MMSNNILFAGCISLYFCFCLLILPCGFGGANAADMPADSLISSHQTITQSSSNATSGTDDGTSKNSALFYPAPILQQLGIDPSDIIKNQFKFKNSRIHIEWMDHVHVAIPGLCREKEDTIIKIHTSLLFIKDRLDNDYFSGQINKQRYTTLLAGTMKWFQETNRSVLSMVEYNTLFGISGQKDGRSPANDSDGKVGFPIQNPETTVDMIKKSFDDTTIKAINRFYHKQSQELKDIREIYETKDFHGVTPEQVKTDILRTEKELNVAFMGYCRDILSNEQFKLLFGSQTND